MIRWYTAVGLATMPVVRKVGRYGRSNWALGGGVEGWPPARGARRAAGAAGSRGGSRCLS